MKTCTYKYISADGLSTEEAGKYPPVCKMVRAAVSSLGFGAFDLCNAYLPSSSVQHRDYELYDYDQTTDTAIYYEVLRTELPQQGLTNNSKPQHVCTFKTYQGLFEIEEVCDCGKKK